jgi:hypothetical protein
MFPTTVVDNFFESPTLIRDYALSLEYSKFDGRYPGKRTEELRLLNPKLYEQLCSKVFSLFFNLKHDKVGWDIDARFQLTDNTYGSGWAHVDGEMYQFAGVVYFNPDAPLNGGTSICKLNKNFDHDYSLRDKFYNDELLDLDEYANKRDLHNSNFDTTVEVSNIFNRLLFYNGNTYHKENNFFGTGNNSRLTLVFFGNMLTYEQTLPPLTRCKNNFVY